MFQIKKVEKARNFDLGGFEGTESETDTKTIGVRRKEKSSGSFKTMFIWELMDATQCSLISATLGITTHTKCMNYVKIR